MLRRWDTTFDAARRDRLKQQDDNAAKIEGGKWLSLENGIEIQFDADAKREYREGDYWLIAARTGGDDLPWEKDANGVYVAQLPHGVEHHYAPLAVLGAGGNLVNLRFMLNRSALFK